ncbi:glycosyltransferase family 1 protein [Noviherbaspirillum sp. CPCC 100848]|uniref:Glycosyltransferase family 1 protein n=2 Tax=Bacteria TaxID=2 RepID=A0ABU6J6K0_9BURK|nr:glycosyltransferase family 1 protein [Noviherbaspirillum sp. CPCC 100848]MEC4719274.1 glycosyltransferase family 1 protein [Noviherbaspirillum sp. CPCC 100848]
MKFLRVGLSTTTIEPVLTGGRLDGIGVYTTALMKGLPEVGCSVTGWSFPPPFKTVRAGMFSAGEKMPRSFEAWSLRDLVLPTGRGRLPMDLFHATDYRIVRMQCPVVATLHDAIPLKHPEWTSPRLRGLKNWLQKTAAGKADHVIAISKFAVAELVEYFHIDERNITVVHAGVGSEWYVPPPPEDVDETLRANGLQSGYFLFVGTLQPRKNVERIIDAYKSLPAAVRRARQLVIVGHAGWRCDDLINKIRTMVQNGEQVIWLSNLAQKNQLRHVYKGAGVFVFPSLHEGFGIPVVEAFASGVPVVTSNTTSLPEVSQGAALEVDPLAVDDIAAAMLALATDDALRQRCIDAGRRRAAQLTWNQAVEKTAAVYRKVLGR